MSLFYVFGKLFAEPSLTEGFSRALDLGGTLQVYNVAETEVTADTEALRNDWRAVGEDMRIAMEAYERESTIPGANR